MATKKKTAKPARKPFTRDRYAEPLPPRFEQAIDVWIAAAYRSTCAKKKKHNPAAKKERRDLATRPARAVRKFEKAVNKLLDASDVLHKILVSRNAFPEELRDVWEWIRPPIVEQAPNPPQRETGLLARLPRDREPVFIEFVESLARLGQLFGIETAPLTRRLPLSHSEWVLTLPQFKQKPETDKTDKPQRIAPITEHSRTGAKIVGWIDKRTGKRVAEPAPTKPTKPTKESEPRSWAQWAALSLQTLASLATLDDHPRKGSGNRASSYRDRVIDEALRWERNDGHEATAARLANAVADRIEELTHHGPSYEPARLVHKATIHLGAGASRALLTATLFGHDTAPDDEEPDGDAYPLASLRRILGDRLKQRRENRPEKDSN